MASAATAMVRSTGSIVEAVTQPVDFLEEDSFLTLVRVALGLLLGGVAHLLGGNRHWPRGWGARVRMSKRTGGQADRGSNGQVDVRPGGRACEWQGGAAKAE